MKTSFTILLLAIAACVCSAQWLRHPPDKLQSSFDDPSKLITGAGSVRGLATSAALDSFIVSQMNAQHLPGLSACIVKNGRVVWRSHYGLANVSRNIHVSDSTGFMLASISKTVTATALMQLQESGRFSLDDSVNRYLPFVVRNPFQPVIPITFRMLLTHTSSIRDNWNVLSNVYVLGDHPMPLGVFLHDYFTPGGQFYDPNNNFYGYAPGTTWNYCNVGAALCGYLTEVISGIPFDRYCRDSIFIPLQMTHTGWFLRDLDTTLIARPYSYTNGQYADHGLYGYPDYPDGQLRTTALSLSRFLLANLGFGILDGVRVLDSATVRLMRTSQVPAINSSQGLIWYKQSFAGLERWGHSGGDAGVRTWMFLSDPGALGAIVLTNGDGDARPILSALFEVVDTITVGVREGRYSVAGRFALNQNYPNPFNPSTSFEFKVPSSELATLKVFDLLGREVATLVDEVKQPGTHTVQWDASRQASGVYFYRLSAGSFHDMKKMLLLR